MRTLILAATLFAGLAGCARNTEPAAAPPTDVEALQGVEQRPATLLPDQSTNGICPFQWTCDDIHWFGTSAACAASAACGTSQCFRDSHCTSGCTCP